MMTIAALAGVGVLAAQAEATAPRVRAQVAVASTAKTTTSTGSGSTGTSANALPANSGSGTRIVYSPGEKRVWLVENSHTVERTMQVVPGTITAPDGDYTVTSKAPGATGGDNVQVLYVVRFGSNYGFDAEANVTGLPPAPTGKTGGIRMAQLDAQALYEFSSVGTAVVVAS
jgi:lipoprotein-anchoring transpeptidase ErfK/SrfK